MLWFGYNDLSVIVISFIMALFPVVNNTLLGLRSTSRNLTELFALHTTSRFTSFAKLQLPGALPHIIAGLRISAGLSVIGAIQLFDIVWVTTKGGPIGASSTMSTFLYDRFRDSRFGFASAVSIVIFGFSLLVALLYQRFALRRDLEGAGPGV